MPRLTTLRSGSPVAPRQVPLRTAVQKVAICRSTPRTPGMTSSPSTSTGSGERLRRAVCSTARSSVVLIFAPVNIRSMASGRPTAWASATSRGRVWSVMRCLA